MRWAARHATQTAKAVTWHFQSGTPCHNRTANMDQFEIAMMGDVVLQSGATLRGTKLAYKTHGTLNAARDNAIVYPTWYGGTHTDNEWLIGPGLALDPKRYFIIVPDMLGNGFSSSPSNTAPPYNQARFPNVTAYDNVKLQHRLVTETFGIDTLQLVTGWSMGALQAFHWGAMYPDMVQRILPSCGSAKCSRHNFVFLEGVKAALTADADWKEGFYDKPPARGLRAMARVYAGWGFSQAFYREQLDIEALGYSSLEDFLVAFWEGGFLSTDANDLLAMLWTWQHGDISANSLYQGNFELALSSIKAKAIVMPGVTDLYFPPEDSQYEVSKMPNAEYRPIPSIWGHQAGGAGLSPVDAKFVNQALLDLLAR
jgi:homoserine O-acetyltransferase/O-succinyltransferase